jgi:uncharacterized membrane protein YwaF
MPAAVISKNKTVNNYCYSVLLPGAIIAMLTPADMFWDYFYLGWFPLFFFIWHFIIAIIPILSIKAGIYRPDIREFPKMIVISLAYMAIIYPLNKLLNTNFLFINTPSRGSLLETYYGWLGNPGYIVPTFITFAAVVFLMYIPWVVCGYIQPR